jgi:hypothetical protein
MTRVLSGRENRATGFDGNASQMKEPLQQELEALRTSLYCDGTRELVSC